MRAFPTDLFAGSRFAVVGLGRNGLAVARALLAMGAEVAAWDDAAAVRAAAGGLPLRDPRAGDFAFDALVLSPGIPHLLPQPHPAAERARAAGVAILSDADLLFQAVRRAGSRARFVGITGTNGKSTTTALLAHIVACAGAPVAAGGNLGTAALALPLLPDDGVYVLEMSSYMLERLATLRFDVAAMLNLSPDHLDRHGDMAGYMAAKRAIFARQAAGDLAVVGMDDADSRAMAAWLRDRPAQVVAVSGEMHESPPNPLPQGEGEPFVLLSLLSPVSPVPPFSLALSDAPALPGAHNAQNAAAAYAIARFLGVPGDAIARAMTSFPGLPHRQQRLGTIRGITFVNDSKATNADAAARALSCYERVVWIAGGLAKQGGIEALAPCFPRIARALLIGRDAPLLAATLAAHDVPHEIAGTLEAATLSAFAAAQAVGAPVVLLSPACASFDQFSGFDARGEKFAALVASLARERAA
ncbi:MAG TPA: UDP-N-acetylmuramoyl-L-alanine--D-glutamate ligase [Acetobacteraceae bacterium]|nr:UDP-N-acetylmuramoyl-L-alanine--D-glutamate ligase [Acetobacteraceae bacterium]